MVFKKNRIMIDDGDFLLDLGLLDAIGFSDSDVSVAENTSHMSDR